MIYRRLAATIAVGVLATGCGVVRGTSDDVPGFSTQTPTPEPTVPAGPTPPPCEENFEMIEIPASWKDTKTAPAIEKPAGDPPCDLEITDVVVGDGAEVKEGAEITVDYIGVTWSTGEVFDASWQRGQTATFPLQGLIPGWQQGIPGMKVGGRRLLVIPPELGYGSQGAGGAIPPNATLIFVIDVRSVS